MSFKINQKIVCINDKFDTNLPDFDKFFTQLPVKDEVYTVRSYESGSVLVEELRNPSAPLPPGSSFMVESGFSSKRFAPLVTDSGTFADEVVEKVTKSIEIKELDTIEL